MQGASLALRKRRNGNEGDNDEEEEDDMEGQVGIVNGKSGGLRSGGLADDESDSDLDM